MIRVADLDALSALVARGAPADPLLRVAALLREEVPEFAARLRLSGAEQERLAALRMPSALAPAADDNDLRRALAGEDGEMLMARSWLAQDDMPGWDGLRARIGAMARPVFPLQGRDVVALGVAPGEAVGTVLLEVRRWWMDGGCVADKQLCIELARQSAKSKGYV